MAKAVPTPSKKMDDWAAGDASDRANRAVNHASGGVNAKVQLPTTGRPGQIQPETKTSFGLSNKGKQPKQKSFLT